MKSVPYLLIVLLSVMLSLSWCSHPAEMPETFTVDTVWMPPVIDTIRDTVFPSPVTERFVKYDTVFIAASGKEPADTSLNDYVPDSVPASIPITEREYKTDDYKILISGYNPLLKSVELYRPTFVGLIKQKNKRWGLGLSAGYGIGADGLSPVLAVTVNYNLFQW